MRNRFKLKLRFLSFVLTFLIASCQPALPSLSVVFTADLDGNQDIYRINISDERVERLTFTPNIKEQLLHVSTDRKKILFDALDNDGVIPRRVYALDTQKMLIESLTDRLGVLSYPGSWSPNEEQIAFLKRDRQSALMVMDSNGINYKEIPLLISDAPSYKYPTPFLDWTMDGKNIIFSAGNFFSQPPLTQNIYIVGLDHLQIRQITTDSLGLCDHPVRSPKKDDILVTCKIDSSLSSLSSVYIINPYDSFAKPMRIGPEDISCFEPSWSPDGSKIALVCEDKKAFTLYLSNPKGDKLEKVNLTLPERIDYLATPIWTADGKQIVYVAGPDWQNTNIFSVNLNGTGSYAITTVPANYSELSIYSP
jgi:Tol biopolymer transport system component